MLDRRGCPQYLDWFGGPILATLIDGLFMMLASQFEAQCAMANFQFEALRGRGDVLERKPDESLGRVDGRLLRIEDHLRGGMDSGGQQE